MKKVKIVSHLNNNSIETKAVFSVFIVMLFVMQAWAVPTRTGVFVSWQDDTIVFGPKNDAALDSPQAIDNMMVFWQSQFGANDILLWRLSAEIQEDPNIWFANLEQGSIWGYVVAKRVTDVFDTTSYAVTKANQLGMTLCGGLEVYSVGIPPSALAWWPVRQKFYDVHPECEVIDRQGNVAWGVPEYGVPLARQYIVDRFISVIGKYNLSAIYVDLRSESFLGIPTPDHGDQFGFNPEVVSDFLNLHGVDITTDPRFDYTSPTYDINDPMVENWRQLRGSYLTQLLRDIRAAIPSGIKIVTAIRGGDYYGWPVGNMAIPWRTWVDEGLIDTFVVNWTMGPPGVNNNTTFIVNAHLGIGVLPVSTFKSYIDLNNPSIVLYSSWFDASAQGQLIAASNEDVVPLQSQLSQFRIDNLSNNGYLGLIEQNFDDFEPDFPGYNETGNKLNGDYRYNSSENQSPGWWGFLGDGNDVKPVVQDVIKRGITGNSMKLTSDFSSTDGVLRGWRIDQYLGSIPSSFEFSKLDTGWVEVSFYVLRSNENSGLTVYLEDRLQSGPFLMGFRIESDGLGSISCQSGTGWTLTQGQIPVGIWEKITIVGDLDNRLMWCFLGDQMQTSLAVNQTFNTLPTEINSIIFTPGGFIVVDSQLVGTNTYVDDVTVRWSPDYTLPPTSCGAVGTQYLLSDINQDCSVDELDLFEMTRRWLQCSDPVDPNCDQFWL